MRDFRSVVSEATKVEATGVSLMHKGLRAIKHFDPSFRSAMHRRTGLQFSDSGHLIAISPKLGERMVAISRFVPSDPKLGVTPKYV